MLPEDPNWRMPAGVAIMLLLIAAWAVAVTTLIDAIGPLPALVQLAIYAIAGIVWIAPLRPLMVWMNRGYRRPPD